MATDEDVAGAGVVEGGGRGSAEEADDKKIGPEDQEAFQNAATVCVGVGGATSLLFHLVVKTPQAVQSHQPALDDAQLYSVPMPYPPNNDAKLINFTGFQTQGRGIKSIEWCYSMYDEWEIGHQGIGSV